MSPWWRVNLSVAYNIARIVVYGRSDCCTERLSGFSVLFATNSSFNLMFKHPMKTPSLMTEVITLSENQAQHVEISLKDIQQALTLCEVFIFGDCQDDMCGWTCDIVCHCTGPIAKQNIIDASCPTGCKTGWWGTSCNNTCDSNCIPYTCNQSNGYCLECSQGKWGHFCDNNCTNCLNDTGCGISDGICSVGCITGVFGISCGEQCGQCAADGSCDRYTGACIHGCQPGWKAEQCTIACPLGWYGTNCSSTCGHCVNTTCDHINGTCPLGCTEGYNGARCKEPCSLGWYGKKCSNTCGNCTNSTCDHINGTCPFGCSAGYNSTRCNESCSRGTYGLNCNKICDHCANITCDHIDGTCHLGCSEGYSGTCSDRQEETSTESTSTLTIGIPVGGALGAAGLTILIIVFAKVYRKRRKRVPKTSEVEHTYDQLDTTRALDEKLSDYSKIEDMGLSPVIPKEITYENTLPKKNLIHKCEFRDDYQQNISLDENTGELRLLSLFKSMLSPDTSKAEVTRTGRADDCNKIIKKSYLFEAMGRKEFTILSDLPTTSESIWRMALEHRIHLIIIIGKNRIHFKPNVQMAIGLIQIECIDSTVERDLLLCNINISECEKDTKMRNVQVILSAEGSSLCIPSNINETLTVLKKRLWLRQGIEGFNTLIICTPDARDGECLVASLLMTDVLERSGYIDLIGIIKAMRKEKHDAINSFDKFKFCYDITFKWIVEEENTIRMEELTSISTIA